MRVRRRMSDDDGESGQITLLSIGFGLLALTLVLVVAAASSIYLERKQLLALADGAAADAADAIDYERYYAGGASEGVPLSDASVQDAVESYLVTSAAAGSFRGLAVGTGTGTGDGRTAQVTLSAVARPAVVPWVLAPWSDGFAITVTSTARAD